MAEVVGILLAAGRSSRFGSDKLHHLLPHGVSISVQAARHLRAAVPRVVAVVRPGATNTAHALTDAGCEVVVCANADEGMGASLAFAVREVGEAAGYVIALADMPFIRPSTIAAVRERIHGGAALAAPYFHTRRGHPVGITGRLRSEVMRLGGDEGARTLLESRSRELVKVPVGDPGVVRDIDRPGDLPAAVRA